MRIDSLILSEIVIFPELFLGISIIYLVLHCTFLTVKQNYPLIQSSLTFLSVLVLFLSFCLLLNDSLAILNINSFNNTLVNDYLSFTVKGFTLTLSLFCLLIIRSYLINQKLNNFEYVLLILFSVLGLLFLCCSNDLITAYLALELQSLSFYVLAAFKKNSSFSVDAGIKYFILGALSSSLFLLGSSILYLSAGTICFSDFKDLFNSVFFVENNKHFSDFLELFGDIENPRMIYYLITNPEFMGGFDMEFIDLPFLKLLMLEGNLMFEPVTNFILFLIYPEHILVGYGLEKFFSSQHLNTDLSLIYNLAKFGLLLILISLFFKLAIAPFHIWSPDVYENSPSSSTLFFSIIPKLAIFVLLIRIFYNSFSGFVDEWRQFMIIFVILTTIVGSFGGLEQRKLKSLLVYSSISHMGYSLIAFSVETFESFQMLFCYLFVYSFSGLCVWSIFISTQLKSNYFQKQNKDLTDLTSLGKSNNILAVFFSTVLFSIAGFPPMIGFLVKISIFLTAIESNMFFVALICILCSVIGTFYYIRLVKILFFEKIIAGKLYYPINYFNSLLISLLFFLFLFLFINPTLLFLFSHKLSLLTLI